MDVSVWRETSTLNDEITTYVLAKGASMAPTRSVTPSLRSKGKWGYNHDDFKAENEFKSALGGQRRDDYTWLGRVFPPTGPLDVI